MKLQVTIEVPSKIDADKSTFDVVAFAADTVACVKERIGAAQDVPFPEHELVFAGRTLDDALTMTECGVKEGASLDFVVRASTTSLAKQLGELLQARSISMLELGMLYSHKFGASPSRALSILGLSGTLADFIQSQKMFTMTAEGCVSLTKKNLILRVSVANTLSMPTLSWADVEGCGSSETFVEIVATSNETVAEVAARAARAVQIPTAFPVLTLRIDGKELDGQSTMPLRDVQVKDSSIELSARASMATLSQQLVDLFGDADELPVTELSILYSSRHGISADQVVKNVLGASRRGLADFLRQQPSVFKLHGNMVSLAPEEMTMMSLPTKAESMHMRYLQLHATASSRDFRTEVSRVLSSVVACIMEATFLSIHHVVTGGPAGVGTAVKDCSCAEVTLFVDGLPCAARETWLPGVLAAVAMGLQESASGIAIPSMQVLGVDADAVSLNVKGLTSVKLRISPVFETHAHALDSLSAQGNKFRSSYVASLAEQEVRFIKKQPEPVKITARLLKVWRAQCSWSSALTRPSDKLLDLLAVHVSQQFPPGICYDQSRALSLARALMCDMNNLCVVWPTPLYGSCAIPASLFDQKPLLMDPVNPFLNVVDAATFNTEEIMNYAKVAPTSLL